MPPPAPPTQQPSLTPINTNSSTFTSGNVFQPNAQTIGGATPAPATPASMMNLGRLGTSSGLTPPQGRTTVEKGKTKSATATGKAKKSGVGTSPGLKAILPAGPTAPSQLTDPSPLPGPVLAVKKTSHKHAEQKRRDSLKSTFDDLRQLLPPIALPTEPDTPILPGALPPRGPPKAGTEGPNKGVSKLQLLICGNEYIRTLKGRVDRRDEEIQKLRKEVGKLRGEVGRLKGVIGEEGEERNEEEEEEEVDLEKDLDAVEALRPSFGRLGMCGGGGQDDDDGDD
ncbi:hypothetical protein BDQ17DRAFT_1388196 [Cyathus striatus]|nr:hypothetical protein BDQ17DRAFT_1388196 [Cyathus striatus]